MLFDIYEIYLFAKYVSEICTLLIKVNQVLMTYSAVEVNFFFNIFYYDKHAYN